MIYWGRNSGWKLRNEKFAVYAWFQRDNLKIYKRRKEKLEEIDELYQAFSNVTSEESGNVISDENNRNLQYKDI